MKTLPFYIKDSQHALWIFRDFNFLGRNNLIFIVDVTSLYIFIPKDGGLRTLKHFFDQRTVKEPSSETLPWHIASPCVPLSLIKCTKCIYTSILLFKIQFYIYVVNNSSSSLNSVSFFALYLCHFWGWGYVNNNQYLYSANIKKNSHGALQ